MSTSRSRFLALGVAVGLTAAVSAPTAVYASHKFSDVPDESVYADAVSYLTDLGVVRGCGDGSTFCPQAGVTRGQLALFLERLSGNGDVPATVNAATVQGMTAEQLRGQTGPQGPAGAQGPPGMSDRVMVQGPETTIGAGGIGGAWAQCPAGTKAVGGGYDSSSIDLKLYEFFPLDRTDGTSGYWVGVMSDATGPRTFRAVAVCVSVS